MEYFITIILSYLLGTINPAKIVARKVQNIDISSVNSKNPGTSNIALTLGLKYAVLVGILDILKGLIPVLIVRFIYPTNDIIWTVAGCSAILGHMYPIHYRFKGGKGTATFGGVVLGIVPLISLLNALIFTVILLKSKFVAIATLFVLIVYPIIFYLKGFHWISILLISLYALLSFYKHFPNFVKIYKKEELGLDSLKKVD